MQHNIQGKMAKGAVWMVLFKFTDRSLGLISTLILARLLVPADFGVVAMAVSFIAMAELLTAFGFDIALIQDQSATVEHYHTAWTGNVLFGLSITVLMIALAAPIADFYRKPEVMGVVVALALGPLISGCENIGVVAFRKELNFRREFVFQLSRKVIGFAVVVPLAFLLRNYWALVAGMLISRSTGTLMSYLMHPFRPRPTVSKFGELFRFSRWLLFNNMLIFFKERSSDFFIGRLLGSASLGIYNVAYELANLPSTELSAPINRALLPGFARLTTPEEVASAYKNTLAVLAMLALPAAAGIFAVAPFLVPVILGPKWIEAVPLLETLAFNGVLLLFHSSISGVLIGRGFPQRITLTHGVYVMLLIVLLWIFSTRFGVVGAAYAALLTSIIVTPLYLYQTKHCLGIGPGVFVRAVARPLLAALLMAVVVRWTLPATTLEMALPVKILWLLTGVAVGVLSYLCIATIIWQLAGRPLGAESMVLDKVRGRLVSVLGMRFANHKR